MERGRTVGTTSRGFPTFKRRTLTNQTYWQKTKQKQKLKTCRCIYFFNSISSHMTCDAFFSFFFSFWFTVVLRPEKPSGLLGTGSPGRPARLSHSSWAFDMPLCMEVSFKKQKRGTTSVQFEMVSICSEKAHMRSTPSLRRCLWNYSSVRLIDDGPLSSFQGRPSNASSFHTSLLQVIDGVVSLALFKGCERNRRQNWRGKRKLKKELILQADGKETDYRMDEGREDWIKSWCSKGMGKIQTIEWTREERTEERANTSRGLERKRR